MNRLFSKLFHHFRFSTDISVHPRRTHTHTVVHIRRRYISTSHSLKQLKNKPISFVPKQPFTPSIQSVISYVPATVSARSFLSINEIVSAERMFNWSQPLKSKVPTTNIKVVYRAFSLPYKIKLDGNCFDIRPFVPAPNQCKQCCQFGHSSFVCNSEQVCSICSGSHFFKQCPTPNTRKCPIQPTGEGAQLERRQPKP